MQKTIAIVLAAGRGTRMKTEVPKVLHEILGRPMIAYVMDALRGAGIRDIITVAGYRNELLRDQLADTKIVVQKNLLGSGDAVNTARALLKGFTGTVLVICGDTPLIQSQTLRSLLKRHADNKAQATLLTAQVKDPSGYGRIVRHDNGAITKIVEHADASAHELTIREVNVGTYCFNAPELLKALGQIVPQNKKKEYYLTDAIELLRTGGKTIASLTIHGSDEMIGVNARADIAHATQILKTRVLATLMREGVTIEDPATTIVYPSTKIGSDTVIHPYTIIESSVTIGSGCHIGPYARLRPQVRLGDNVEIGNFVELVRTTVGDGTKIKHHTYLGDAVIGKKVNIGAGTITANFDGVAKNTTTIGDGAFIGIGARLIAPVTIGKRALVGAGCVVPKKHHVPDGATVVGIPARIMTTKSKTKG